MSNVCREFGISRKTGYKLLNRHRTRDEANADLFAYMKVFYNRIRRHGYLGNNCPVDFEDQSNGSF